MLGLPLMGYPTLGHAGRRQSVGALPIDQQFHGSARVGFIHQIFRAGVRAREFPGQRGEQLREGRIRRPGPGGADGKGGLELSQIGFGVHRSGPGDRAHHGDLAGGVGDIR
ncbi:MAG: hypothetical protein L0Y38_00325, partial [Methylococcaceae bacterium]|nr:hypothetical protein [Methylococcaceae bacterium]